MGGPAQTDLAGKKDCAAGAGTFCASTSSGSQGRLSEARFKLDEHEPSGAFDQPTDVMMIDGVHATMFYGSNPIMGDTREVWFIHGGFLYEVTTFKQLDSWLAGIMQTWRFVQ
jgi:hypothetical protein